MAVLQKDKTKKFRTLEEKILFLQQEGKNKSLSLAEILQVLSGKGQSLILILLSLPFCQPIQIPGLSTPFGLMVAFIGLRMAFGKKIWLPKKLLKKDIPKHSLNKITEKTLHLIRKMKPWIHPRFTWISRSFFMKKGNGLMIFVLGLLLALPLPIPMSNLTAAWSILLIAFGTLEDDGIFILTGYLVSLLTFVFFLMIALGIKKYLFI